MANTITGTILAISKQETIISKSGTQFIKQCVFLDNSRFDPNTGDKYENNLILEFINPKDGDIAQAFKKGDKVTVSFRLRGFDYIGKTSGKKEYGISVSCYRIEPYQTQGAEQAVQQPVAQPAVQASPVNPPQAQPRQAQVAQDDDLPF